MEGTRIAEILSEHRECYASCNRSHPHCANYIHGSQDVWPCETFELATLAAQAERYREALEITESSLEWLLDWKGEIRPALRELLNVVRESLRAAAALEKEAEGD